VGTLEAQLQQLQGSFQTALEDVQTKAARVGELEAATTALEGELNEAKGAYASLQAEREGDNTLQRVKDEVRIHLIAC
jgi:chromosome segregation ATPase